MQITNITVSGLFGTFKHPIPLNTQQRMTIIYGPNGFGKTTLFRMIDWFFHGQYADLCSVEFTQLTIDFNDGAQIEINKMWRMAENETSIEDWFLNIILFKNDEAPDQHSVYPSQIKREIEAPLPRLINKIPGLRQISSQMWRYVPTNEILRLEDIIERFGEQLSANQHLPDEPAWLREIREAINVRLVKTQRLEAIPVRRTTADRVVTTTAVDRYADELRVRIQQTLADYGATSQKLDRTFPVRIFEQLQGNQQHTMDNLSQDDISKRLNDLEKKREKYQKAGLLDQKDKSEAELQVGENMKPDTRSVLSIYVEDNEEKLNVLDNLARKIELLQQIINDHFTYKRIKVTRGSGFTFTAVNGHNILLSELSSGEQHELVLLYELLFKTSPNSLIIIDEPEISLHVVWQQEFLRDLQMITELSPFDVLIATHAPEIIYDRWDLTVALEGPEESWPDSTNSEEV